MAEERERSGGKTDYVWGRHDKHRNMINSTQPHPGPSAHRLPSIASTLRFNPCRDHLHLTYPPVSPFRSLAAAGTCSKSSAPRFSARSISLPPLSCRGNRSGKKNRPIFVALSTPTPSGKLARRVSGRDSGGGRGGEPTTSFLINDFKARSFSLEQHAIESKDKRKTAERRGTRRRRS